MKKMIFLFAGIFLLTACHRPIKLLEKGHTEKAFRVSLKKLRSGKVKSQNLYALEKSFMVLTEKESRSILAMRQSNDPSIWLDIHERAVNIEQRQTKLAKVVTRVNRKGHYLKVNYYPAKALIDESSEKAAAFLYKEAEHYIELATYNNDRNAARKAHELLEQIPAYKPGYKDSNALTAQMYKIGTTHILFNPEQEILASSVETEMVRQLFRNSHFPKRNGWTMVHAELPQNETIDYRLDLGFRNMHVSPDYENIDFCRNTKEVKVGEKTTQVWSQSDSAYVEVIEDIYETVSASVETITQEKNASLRIIGELIDVGSGELVDDFNISAFSSWCNSFSRVWGDTRALDGSCNDRGGFIDFHPSNYEMLVDAIRCRRSKFNRVWKRTTAVL